MADSFGSIAFDVLVDGSTGSYPMPTYPTYGSTRHVPNSVIDIIQHTGTGPGVVTYSIVIAASDYANLLTDYQAIPRVHHTLTVGASMSYWYIDSITDTQLMIDGRVMCTITFHESL